MRRGATFTPVELPGVVTFYSDVWFLSGLCGFERDIMGGELMSSKKIARARAEKRPAKIKTYR